MEQEPFQYKKMGVGEAQELENTVEGFKGHVATDGSTELDYDEEMEPLHGMYGSMEAELEVQRTIKKAELTAFFCLRKRVIGPIKVHVDNTGIIDGLWRGESEYIKRQAGDADLWIKIWEELHLLASRNTVVEVEHVKAHRKKKEKREMSSSLLKVMRKRMSWRKKEQCWTKVSWRS